MVDIEKDAKELLANAKKQREEVSKKPEARDAGPDSSSEKAKTKDEVEKAEADKKAQDAETQKKQDEEILSKEDDELKDDEKQRKAEIVKSKQEIEDKEKKSNVQRRFDELTSTIKSLKDKGSTDETRIKSLETELDGIKKKLSMTPQDEIKSKVKDELVTRQSKYIEEDKALPREDRREMTKEEYDEWLNDDQDAAQEWREKRTVRRFREEENVREDILLTKKAESLLDKQQESAKRTYEKHPELNIHKRQTELLKEGKSKQEIFDILCKEVPKYKLGAEIFKSNPEKYMLAENGPELVIAEIEKALGGGSPEQSEKEKLKAEIAALKEEKAQLEGLDFEVSSTRHSEPKSSEPEIVKKTEELGGSLGLSKEQVRKALERRKNVR